MTKEILIRIPIGHFCKGGYNNHLKIANTSMSFGYNSINKTPWFSEREPRVTLPTTKLAAKRLPSPTKPTAKITA